MVVLEKKLLIPSDELKVFYFLSKRKSLLQNDHLKLRQLMKGFAGEISFYDQLCESLHQSAIILPDIKLRFSDSEVQIDSLALIDNDIYLFEVKNYSGDFIIKNDSWYNVKSKNEIRDPLSQLNRTRYLFQKILKKQNFKFRVHPYLIFINQEFTLHNSPINSQLILPTQINRFFNHLRNYPFTHNHHHKRFVDYLTKNQLDYSSYMKMPKYTFAELKKGFLCLTCHHYLTERTNKQLICTNCKLQIPVSLAVMNNVKQLSILFPNKKITTAIVHKWCGELFSKATIWRVLTKYMKKVGKTKGTYYLFDETNEYYKKIRNKISRAINTIIH